MNALTKDISKFGVVGLAAYIVDVGVFNLLRFSNESSPFADRPLSAKAVSVSVAIAVAYFGNRNWTYRERTKSSRKAEVAKFLIINAIAMGIALACLGTSHYVLGYTSAAADNISANGVGLVLGTLFRFWGYRHLVFKV